ncbi:AbrB/MazE/SpoVT family DNA-binding domain-containing protein [Candidatus Woesearchaeota archaeon]|nr:AbrB/MazE/SpoVT family DNA-binding domain-containing protein [Candidatus Woesearchaeota archaeon]
MIICKYVKMGERGQIVIPKEIREKECLIPNQSLKIMHLDGEIIIRIPKQTISPEDLIFRAFKNAKFDRQDWEDIQKDRER